VNEDDRSERHDNLQARYANFFQVGFNNWEFVIDFGYYYEGDAAPAIHSRIILAPPIAADLLELLERTVADHKRSYGPAGETK
jgi:hypothetical protein